MKRRFMVPVAAVALFGLMAAFATVAQAFPTKTTACTGCHGGVNVPVTATAGAASGTTVSYQLSAPSADAIAVFDGATKVAALGASGAFSATVGKTYAVYAVTGPTTGDGLGSTSFTVAAPVVVPAAPAAPVLNATYNTTTGNVTIAWTAVSGATGYDYQVGTGAVTSTTGTSVSLTGLAVGNTAFKLRATNSGGPSAYAASTIVYTVPVVVPAAPAAPVLNATYNTTTGNVTIAWTAVSGATGYDYQVGTGAVTSTTGTSVSLTGLAVGNTAFKLRATNSGGPSAYAASTIVYTVPVVVPAAPAAPVLNATYNTTTGNVTIAWTAVSGATGYDYQVGTGAVTSTTGTSVSLTGLAVGNTAFKLRATNSGGPSAYAASTIVYTVPVVVPSPTGYPVKMHLDVKHRYASRLTATLTDQAHGCDVHRQAGRRGQRLVRQRPGRHVHAHRHGQQARQVPRSDDRGLGTLVTAE